MSIKTFLLKQMMKKQGLPDEQVEMFVKMFEKNPDLFKNIAEEAQTKMKSGKDQMTAMKEVMAKYEKEVRALM